MKFSPITANEVRFIKLGEKGRWEKECVEGPKPCIRLGFSTGHHAESLVGKWQVLTDHWRNVGKKTPGKTTEFYIATNFLGHGTVNPKANESDD